MGYRLEHASSLVKDIQYIHRPGDTDPLHSTGILRYRPADILIYSYTFMGYRQELAN
jgi:hypothetical protein